MTNQNLLTSIIGDAGRIATAISTGAAWEIWMQVELILLLRGQNVEAARELPYPAPNQALSLDAAAKDNQGRYAIELKVESANAAGAQVLAGVRQDAAKILNFNFGPVVAGLPTIRWVVGIGYSEPGKTALRNFAGVPANHAIYNVNNNIGVMVVTV
jgi:hypothetical protein